MTHSLKRDQGLLLFALFGLGMWAFGNLYEEVVLMPNWLAAPLDVLVAYNRYYTVVIQYHYYVPLTQLAVVGLGYLSLSRSAARQVAGRPLRRGLGFGLAALALTAVIVTQLNLKLFIGPLSLPLEEAHRLGLLWMVGNAVRLVLVFAALIETLRVLDAVRRAQRS